MWRLSHSTFLHLRSCLLTTDGSDQKLLLPRSFLMLRNNVSRFMHFCFVDIGMGISCDITYFSVSIRVVYSMDTA